MAHEDSLRATLAQRMRPLRAHYFESLRQRMQVIERAMVMLVGQEFDQAQERRSLQTVAHKLAGTGATYGFPQISEAGKALEDAMTSPVLVDDQVLLDLVGDLMNVCHEALATSVASAPGKVTQADTAVPGEPGRPILVADDDEAVRELLAHKLRSVGCLVTCAVDGAQAWALLQTQPYALVVLDQMMPGHDGMSLLKMMKMHPSTVHTPVVFLTARDLSADVLEGLNTGADDYITKPFNSDEVVSRCTRLLRRAHGSMRM